MFTLSDSNLSTTKSKHTNIINRIKAILVEDVSPLEVRSFVEVLNQLSEFQRLGPSNPENEQAALGSIWRAIFTLFSAKKLRVCSHLRILSHPNCLSAEPHKLQNWQQVFDLSKIKPTQTYRATVALAIGQHYRAVFDIPNQQAIDTHEIEKLVTKKKKKSDFVSFWNRLYQLADGCLLLKTNLAMKREFFEERKFFTEELVVLISAAESVIGFVSEMFDPKISAQPAVDDYGGMTNMAQHILPEFGIHVRDKHVAGGYGGTRFFVEQGAKISNEDAVWALPAIHELYQQTRISQSAAINSKRLRDDNEDEHNKKRKKIPLNHHSTFGQNRL